MVDSSEAMNVRQLADCHEILILYTGVFSPLKFVHKKKTVNYTDSNLPGLLKSLLSVLLVV